MCFKLHGLPGTKNIPGLKVWYNYWASPVGLDPLTNPHMVLIYSAISATSVAPYSLIDLSFLHGSTVVCSCSGEVGIFLPKLLSMNKVYAYLRFVHKHCIAFTQLPNWEVKKNWVTFLRWRNPKAQQACKIKQKCTTNFILVKRSRSTFTLYWKHTLLSFLRENTISCTLVFLATQPACRTLEFCKT